MLCRNCSSPEMFGEVSFTFHVLLAPRLGALHLPHDTYLSGEDIKARWELTHDRTQKKKVLGPIVCRACGAEHIYLTDYADPHFRLHLVKYDVIRHLPYEELLTVLFPKPPPEEPLVVAPSDNDPYVKDYWDNKT